MMAQLTGKAAIVTGGGTGIGRGIALALARQGARVVVCGRRQAPLDECKAEIAGAVGLDYCLAYSADVSDHYQVEKLVEYTVQKLGTIDILVNNAGIGGGSEVHTHSLAEWDKILAVNLSGPFLMARAVLPVMRDKRSGHILNISSESALNYYSGDGAYGISKHALNALGEYIQVENQDYDIRVDTICPGMVISEMTEASAGLNQQKCLYPEDIADLCIWLLTRRRNIKIGRPVLIQTMENPWE